MGFATSTPAAIEAFQQFYVNELDERIKHSSVVGAITLEMGSAALFYDDASEKFTLLEKHQPQEEAVIYECVPHQQWGRTIMLIGHLTHSGGFTASGHATLNNGTLKIKFANGVFYNIKVDDTLAHLQPYVHRQKSAGSESQQTQRRQPIRAGQIGLRKDKPQGRRSTPAHSPSLPPVQAVNESEDLTIDDLRRLRGEISMEQRPSQGWDKRARRYGASN